MHLKTFVFCMLLTGAGLSSVALAKEVTQSYNGLTLNAGLELAADKKRSDGVILITHGGLANRGMEFVTYLQSLLHEHGYNTLAINLSLGIDNRHGPYDCSVTHRHRNSDAADEIGKWVEWLGRHGVKRVILLGHSRGGAQTALYAAEQDNDLIKSVILMAPATASTTDASTYQRRYHKSLAPLLEKARKLIKEGKGNTVLTHIGLMNCPDTSATADSFVSYYGQDLTMDTPYLLPKIKKPTLVLVAGNDEVVVDLGKKVAPLADGNRLQVKVIDGSGHLFRDLYTDDAVDAIGAFLKQWAQ